jgi:hypothetical protein
MKTFKQYLSEGERSKLPALTGFAAQSSANTANLLVEGKWVNAALKVQSESTRPRMALGKPMHTRSRLRAVGMA